MAIPLLYLFDSKSREFKGSRPAQLRPNGKPILDAMFATPDPPGPEKKQGLSRCIMPPTPVTGRMPP